MTEIEPFGPVRGAPRRVLLVEDHPLVAETMAAALRAAGLEVRALLSAAGFDEIIVDYRPHLVVLDLDIDPSEPRGGLRLIGPAVQSGAEVVVVTGTRDRPDLAACLEAGACGVIAKHDPVDSIVEMVTQAAHGEWQMPVAEREQLLADSRRRRAEGSRRLRPFETLTTREAEVLRALCDGSSASEIARQTYVSITTVRGHIQNILRKLGVSSQLSATAMARQAGWHVSAPADS